jgi:hypothetical protein
MELQFESLSPEEAARSNAKVIITTHDEACMIKREGVMILDVEHKYLAIAKAKILRSLQGERVDDQLVVGIDPGNRIGISAIYLHKEIASTVESSVHDAIEHVSAILAGIKSHKKVVKIGDGNISMAWQIASKLKAKFHDSIELEIVDEYGTSQNPDANKRGERDKSSARTIAFRSGKSFL